MDIFAGKYFVSPQTDTFGQILGEQNGNFLVEYETHKGLVSASRAYSWKLYDTKEEMKAAFKKHMMAKNSFQEQRKLKFETKKTLISDKVKQSAVSKENRLKEEADMIANREAARAKVEADLEKRKQQKEILKGIAADAF